MPRNGRRCRVAVRLLPNRSGQDIFLSCIVAGKLGDEIPLAHDADSITQTQDLRQVAGNNEDRHVLLARKFVQKAMYFGPGTDIDSARRFIDNQ